MKKIFILFFAFLTYSFSSTLITALYKIEYGSFLPLGEAFARIDIDEKNNYTILIEAKTTGLARIFSNNRKEIYKSKGKFINNKFVPKQFTKIRKDDFNEDIKNFFFDNQNKKIEVFEKSETKKRVYDSNLNMNFETIKKQKNYDLNYYAKEDILSLFFNLKSVYPLYKEEINYRLKALGANKTKGLINIFIPKNKEELNEKLKTESDIKFIVYINQKIFQSKQGELMISLDKNGFCDYAVLKDVLLFGDITGELTDLEIAKGY